MGYTHASLPLLLSPVFRMSGCESTPAKLNPHLPSKHSSRHSTTHLTHAGRSVNNKMQVPQTLALRVRTVGQNCNGTKILNVREV